jgi:2-polyprenyl-6-methoxyphenol hydroxylase-like FAD-dependent oxidoreductase
MPSEPYQRCSQSLFEAWLKVKIEAHELIESHWGTKLVEVSEREGRVIATVDDMKTGQVREIETRYLLGCDGGGSLVRRKLELGLTGSPL